jgi:hypothetical protein
MSKSREENSTTNVIKHFNHIWFNYKNNFHFKYQIIAYNRKLFQRFSDDDDIEIVQ